MVFLVNKENTIVIKVSNSEEAKNFVTYYKEKNIHYEIIGVKNKQTFFLLYPEYKNYDFIDNDGFKFQ